MTRIRRILFASDFSRASRNAFAAAINLAKTNHASLTILFAYMPIVPLVPGHYIDDSTWVQIDADSRRWRPARRSPAYRRRRQW